MSTKEPICVSIDQFNAKGWGTGTHLPSESALKKKVEVIGSLPGDELSVRLYQKRKGKWRADLLEILQPSLMRTEPRCSHVPICGGCAWQQMDYSAQLKEKEKRVKNIFAHLLEKGETDFQEIVPCDNPWQYRNKMEFSFSENLAGEKFLGLVIAGSRGHVFNLTECHLVSSWYATLLGSVRTWWQQSGVKAYRMNNTGSLRTLIVREGKRTSDKLVMLTVSGKPEYALSQHQLKNFVEAVKASVPIEEHARLSIFLRIQQIHQGSPTQFFEMHLFGPDHLLEKMTLSLDLPVELIFKVSPTSFFQPNTYQAEKLYSLALNMVSFPKKHALDLYAGTATLGMAMAARAQKVTAIELNPHACFDAKSNQELNGFTNLEILCGDVGKKLAELKSRSDFIDPDLIVVDPPRTGLDSNALAHLKALLPQEILYISYNPETQLINIQELVSSGYRLSKMQPVDQFPHTPHIENIALLTRTL